MLADVAAAANWYDREGHAGLGDRFLITFYSHIQQLLESGEIYRVVYSDFRRTLLKPFPYSVYFRYHEDSLIISLVIHAARNPERIETLLQMRK